MTKFHLGQPKTNDVEVKIA